MNAACGQDLLYGMLSSTLYPQKSRMPCVKRGKQSFTEIPFSFFLWSQNLAFCTPVMFADCLHFARYTRSAMLCIWLERTTARFCGTFDASGVSEAGFAALGVVLVAAGGAAPPALRDPVSVRALCQWNKVLSLFCHRPLTETAQTDATSSLLYDATRHTFMFRDKATSRQRCEAFWGAYREG